MHLDLRAQVLEPLPFTFTLMAEQQQQHIVAAAVEDACSL